ncbi:hypothetical protein [Pseudobacteriovorax antillogorgiicola]|uniref:Lipoprotein n=1 Tax=Pseudobacteriovorax antillogorgiicola TaxID=1513793 RepID=A0A1Y6BMS3_9BACT|nr:hypothetical protein [Pseudobacteriovorax antillogorgiicola]TCS54532.1 hypothetical protein EDD56_10645 [Pseudobacteriovorax antillogorgiicola]SMF18718.1 hypothetical protein SAMN06296036_106198 [Pseudobacteriovorax antillogorgiicola]
MKRSAFGAWLVLSLALGACEQKEHSQVDSSTMTSLDVIDLETHVDLDFYQGQVRDDLKELFCTHVFLLPLKSDFNEELSYLCTDGQPNQVFHDLDRYAEAVADRPRSVRLALEQDEQRSHGVFATVYRVPIQPKWVRSADIGSFMVQASNFDYVQQRGRVVQNLDDSVGGDLQFGKSELDYETFVVTPDGQRFSNQRQTELNSFQVQGGNSHIGIGAEHLLASENDDYLVYNTLTVTIGTDGDGSVLITIIRLQVNHNGFPEVAEQVMSDLATAQASHVRQGLLTNLSEHILR